MMRYEPLDLKRAAQIGHKGERGGFPADTVAQRQRPWPAAKNLAGVDVFNTTAHYLMNRTHGKVEERAANSPRWIGAAEIG
jgi:hypothetical protein